MNEKAISDKQLAISENRVDQASLQLPSQPVSLIVYHLSVIPSFRGAISFTVTPTVTSVTNRRLAEGVLIKVGEVYSEQGQKAPRTAKHEGLALPYRSFREGTCIQ